MNLLGLYPLKELVELVSFYPLTSLHYIRTFSAGAVYGSCFHSFVFQLDFIQTAFKAALMKYHIGKNVENMFLGCGLFLFHSPPPQVICKPWLSLGFCPYITPFLYIDMLTSYFNVLVERAILVAPEVWSSSLSEVVQKSSFQLSGRWLLLLEEAPSAGGLTWDLQLFDLLLCSWNS